MCLKEFEIGCQRPKTASKSVEQEAVTEALGIVKEKEEVQSMVKVGKPAPNFTAPAYYQGKFVETSLEDYKGKWVLLCFYPGDFTFV